VFVSHWLEEVFRIANRITVLRDSKLVGSRPAAELDHATVINMMVGRDVAEVTTSGRETGKSCLRSYESHPHRHPSECFF
jgi:ABC-type sugar transport system ATPase subunit